MIELDRWRSHPETPVAPAALGWLRFVTTDNPELESAMPSDTTTTPSSLNGWMRFFTEAKTWTEVPPEIATPALESAFAALAEFKTNPEKNALYRSRLESMRARTPAESEPDGAGNGEAEASAEGPASEPDTE